MASAAAWRTSPSGWSSRADSAAACAAAHGPSEPRTSTARSCASSSSPPRHDAAAAAPALPRRPRATAAALRTAPELSLSAPAKGSAAALASSGKDVASWPHSSATTCRVSASAAVKSGTAKGTTCLPWSLARVCEAALRTSSCPSSRHAASAGACAAAASGTLPASSPSASAAATRTGHSSSTPSRPAIEAAEGRTAGAP
mmetsp:Transcript_12310/g.38458  ORF Transcript_12310/g.38458 Transcript_12310/m.38458 type:complete len:201 (-) Transcript_12310:48-650(-)